MSAPASIRCASALVEADGAPRRCRGVARRERRERRLELRDRRCRARRAARGAPTISRAALEHEVDALLLREPADDAEQRHARLDRQPERAPAARACCRAFAARRVGVVAAARSAGRSRGFHSASSMPLRMPCSTSRARGEHALQAEAERLVAGSRARRSGSRW